MQEAGPLDALEGVHRDIISLAGCFLIDSKAFDNDLDALENVNKALNSIAHVFGSFAVAPENDFDSFEKINGTPDHVMEPLVPDAQQGRKFCCLPAVICVSSDFLAQRKNCPEN